MRLLPPTEKISVFRVGENEVEQELRTPLGLATPDDPEPVASARSAPHVSSKELENPAQAVEPTSSSRLAPDAAPPILNRSNPPAQSSSDMQAD